MKRAKRKFINTVRFFVKHGIRPISFVCFFIAPFVTLYTYGVLGWSNSSVIWSTIGVLVFGFILSVLSDIINVGNDVPIPPRRFTIESEQDGVSIKREDIQEIILYLDELENWLERKGLM